MGKKKTSNRGRKPKDEADSTHTTLSKSDKAAYHTKKVRKHCGTLLSSEAQPGSSTPKRP